MDEVIDRLSVRLYSSTVGAAAPGEDEDAVDDAEAEAKKASTEDCPAGWEAVSQRLVRLNVAIEFDIQFGLVERFVYRVDGNRCYTPNLGKFQFKDLHFKAQVRRLAAAAECGSREIATRLLWLLSSVQLRANCCAVDGCRCGVDDCARSPAAQGRVWWDVQRRKIAVAILPTGLEVAM